MKIPDGASVCPYCHSRLLNDWGLPTRDSLGLGSGNSNNGCMVILPFILVFAASAFYLINTFI